MYLVMQRVGKRTQRDWRLSEDVYTIYMDDRRSAITDKIERAQVVLLPQATDAAGYNVMFEVLHLFQNNTRAVLRKRLYYLTHTVR